MTLSQRKKYWLGAFVWLGLVYGSIPLVRPVCSFLRDVTPFNVLVNSLVIILLALYLWQLLSKRKNDAWTIILIVLALGVYAFGLWKIRIPEERIHFVQYGILAYLLHRAVRLDIKGGRAYVISLVIVSILGWIDEIIQSYTPGRFYDNRDVVINVLSAFMGLWLDFIDRRRLDSSFQKN
ncbi:MAG: hypothetical protein A2Z88_11225 [Omnitrophica WOR_2 bacterium GWA2_47_8]|nr:MAG: hypothetical protein A2Z88_11225 [Omnitrophica WOR_2 bacterium GWA2_47_8]